MVGDTYWMSLPRHFQPMNCFLGKAMSRTIGIEGCGALQCPAVTGTRLEDVVLTGPSWCPFLTGGKNHVSSCLAC